MGAEQKCGLDKLARKEDEPRGWLVPRGSDLKEGMNLAIWLVSRAKWSPLSCSGGRFRRIGGAPFRRGHQGCLATTEISLSPSPNLYGI